ncbi:MAG TPA: hypothetical protein VFZ49_04865 [Pyrinomonadaceae bacterium]
MFEEKKRGTWNYTWAGIIGVVIIIIGVIQIFRVNPPERPQETTEPKIVWTEGEVFKGEARVDAGGYLSYSLNLNRRATLKVFFTTGKHDVKLDSSVIKAEDFNMWKNGEGVPTQVTTGLVPRGTITKVLEPGNYFFLLDNRKGTETVVLTELNVRIE